jgi:hypothetical protein
MILLICLVFLLILGLVIFFYFLHLRVEAMVLRLGKILKDMDVLYSNQKTLETDLKKIFIELQNVQKEIHRVIHK